MDAESTPCRRQVQQNSDMMSAMLINAELNDAKCVCIHYA